LSRETFYTLEEALVLVEQWRQTRATLNVGGENQRSGLAAWKAGLCTWQVHGWCTHSEHSALRQPEARLKGNVAQELRTKWSDSLKYCANRGREEAVGK